MQKGEGTDNTAEFPSNWLTFLFVRKWRIGIVGRGFNTELRRTEMHDNYQRGYNYIRSISRI